MSTLIHNTVKSSPDIMVASPKIRFILEFKKTLENPIGTSDHLPIIYEFNLSIITTKTRLKLKRIWKTLDKYGYQSDLLDAYNEFLSNGT